MKRQKRNWWIGLCGVFAAFGLTLGIWTSAPVEAAAASATPTLTMEVGASVRKKGEPGIKFTAVIADSSEVEYPGYNFGMIILPEDTWDILGWWERDNVDYIKDLADNGQEFGTYVGKDCNPYVDKDGKVKISLSMTNIYTENYAREFIGVAYAEKNGSYIYAPISAEDNARSVTYVAQKALLNETNLDSEQLLALQDYANPGVEILNVSRGTGFSLLEIVKTIELKLNKNLNYNFEERNKNESSISLLNPTKLNQTYFVSHKFGLDEIIDSQIEFYKNLKQTSFRD
jgi:DNA-binding phage protein